MQAGLTKEMADQVSSQSAKDSPGNPFHMLHIAFSRSFSRLPLFCWLRPCILKRACWISMDHLTVHLLDLCRFQKTFDSMTRLHCGAGVVIWKPFAMFIHTYVLEHGLENVCSIHLCVLWNPFVYCFIVFIICRFSYMHIVNVWNTICFHMDHAVPMGMTGRMSLDSELGAFSPVAWFQRGLMRWQNSANDSVDIASHPVVEYMHAYHLTVNRCSHIMCNHSFLPISL